MDNPEEKKNLLDKYFETNSTFDLDSLLMIMASDLRADYPSNHNIVGKKMYHDHVEKTAKVRYFQQIALYNAYGCS